MKQNNRFIKLLCAVLIAAILPITPALATDGERRLVLGGELFGVELDLDGVLVTDYAPFFSGDAEVCPAKEAGLLPGDLICEVSGTKIREVGSFSELVERSKGETLSLSVLRGGERVELTLQTKKGEEDGKFHAGIWAKEQMAGVGTVSFYDPETCTFGGLGHGVCDTDSETLLPIAGGRVYPAVLKSVVRGKAGSPGELCAAFESEVIGEVSKNTERGVFGTAKGLGDDAQSLEVASRESVHTGSAELVSTVDAAGPVRYDIEITEIYDLSRETKNFLVTVKDESLLEKTGGIVQGMSGSPVIQNGKLVGAVTHVLVNDPTRGYAIFIENMLETANQVAEEQAKKDAS